MKTKALCFALMLVLGLPLHAAEEHSGSAMYPLLKKLVDAMDENRPPDITKQEGPEMMYLMGCIEGAFQAWKISEHNGETISLPKKASFPQLLRVLLKFEKDHPEVTDEPVSALAAVALWDAFKTDK